MPAVLLDLLIIVPALALALALRPWRMLGAEGPPWPWLAWWTAMPLLWGADHYTQIAVLQPLSGSALLCLLTGWPLAMLALVPVALAMGLLGGLPWDLVLHRLAWLGVMPGTLALVFGTLLRRWLPAHLFIYILGRAFLGTMLMTALAGALALLADGAPLGSLAGDVLVARWLAASGEAFLTGMLVAIFVAFRPHWLATYSDRLYLPPKPGR